MISPACSKPIQLAILIYDQAFDQKMYKRILQRSGLVEEVMCFQVADLALNYLCSDAVREIDVIFLDIHMPRMNGFEFLERATALLGDALAHVCVVMLTTSQHAADQARADTFHRLRGYLHKPLTDADVAHIADLVAEHRAGLALPGASLAAQVSADVIPATNRPV